MSWTFVGSAVGLFETEGSGTLTPVGLLKQTSTASVVLTSVGVLGTSARIQMYFDKQDLSGDADGLDTREIYWLGEHEQTAACVPSGSGSHRDLFLTWIESTPEWVSAAPFTNTDLSLDITIGVVNERLQSGGHPMGNTDRKSTRLNSSHSSVSRMPSSA